MASDERNSHCVTEASNNRQRQVPPPRRLPVMRGDGGGGHSATARAYSIGTDVATPVVAASRALWGGDGGGGSGGRRGVAEDEPFDGDTRHTHPS